MVGQGDVKSSRKLWIKLFRSLIEREYRHKKDCFFFTSILLPTFYLDVIWSNSSPCCDNGDNECMGNYQLTNAVHRKELWRPGSTQANPGNRIGQFLYLTFSKSSDPQVNLDKWSSSFCRPMSMNILRRSFLDGG